MYPCSNPQICGVTNHRDGTTCKSKKSSGSNKTQSSSGLLNMSSASSSQLDKNVETLRKDNPHLRVSPFKTKTSESDSIILVDSENGGVRILDASAPLDQMGDQQLSEMGSEIYKNSDGEYWIDDNLYEEEQSPVLLDDIDSDSRNYAQVEFYEDGESTFYLYEAVIHLRDNDPETLGNARTLDPDHKGSEKYDSYNQPHKKMDLF